MHASPVERCLSTAVLMIRTGQTSHVPELKFWLLTVWPAGVRASVIHSMMPREVMREELARFRVGDLEVLFNVEVCVGSRRCHMAAMLLELKPANWNN